MKLKKFNQFISEDLDPEIDAEVDNELDNELDNYDSVEDFRKELGEEELGEDEFDHMDDDDDEFSTENEEEFEEESDDIVSELGEEVSGEEEEEGHEYRGNLLMQELASKLGSEVVNNQIEYNGQKINYYSETEKFHIGREKFETIEEVLDFLKPEANSDLESEVNGEEEFLNKEEELEGVGESRKYIKRFK